MRHMQKTAYYHLPGLFEFYELYRIFLPLFREHQEYFYDWCDIDHSYSHEFLFLSICRFYVFVPEQQCIQEFRHQPKKDLLKI